MERVFHVEGPGGGLVPPPKPARGAFDRLLAFRAAVAKAVGPAVPLSVTQVVDLYRGDRRHKMYLRAAESLLVEDLQPRDAWVSAFVKAEKLNLDKKPDPAPRIISPRSPRYNLRIGQYLKHVEKRVFEGIRLVYQAKWGCRGPIVCKGLTALGLGRVMRSKWEGFSDPVAVGLDASRFDQHVSEQALKWEHGLYLALYRGEPRRDLARLLAMQVVNYGVAKLRSGRVKFKVRGGRMSGDINTSLGNCVIMTGLVYRYAEEKGIRIDLANNGDDCVIIMERRDLQAFQQGLDQWFLTYGFSMKVEQPVYHFSQIEFCQTKPIRVAEGWTMCRTLAGLSKDVYTILPINVGKMAYGWASAISDSGLAIASGVPVFGALYAKLAKLGKGIKLGTHPAMIGGGLWYMAQGMTRGNNEVSDQTRVDFWDAFGMPPYIQRLLEEHIEHARVSLDTRSVIRKRIAEYADTDVLSLRHHSYLR